MSEVTGTGEVSNHFVTEVLLGILVKAKIKPEDLNSLENQVKETFVSGTEKLYRIDKDGREIKPVEMEWLPNAVHTLFETAIGPDEKLRGNKATEAKGRVEAYIASVKQSSAEDRTGGLRTILDKLSSEELLHLVTRKF